MTWFRIDDALPTHPKILSIPRGQRRLQALGAWTLSGAWVSRAGTDGHIPHSVLNELAITPKVAEDLVLAGLWEKNGTGYWMHDYLDYNPSAADVALERAERHEAKVRAGRAGGLASARRRAQQTGSNHQAERQADA